MSWNREKKRIKGIRLLIFDLDGTLADTIGTIGEAVNEVMRAFSFDEKSDEEVRAAIGNGAKALIDRCIPGDSAVTREQREEMYRSYHEAYGRTYSHCQSCYEGIEKALADLKKRGYTLAVLSNKQDVYVKALTEQLLPKGTVAMAVGQTERPKKPDPTVPLDMARTLGFTAEETAFVGDSEVDIQTAKRAGMLPVGCSWGYREASLLRREGAAMILDAPAELLEAFREDWNERRRVK